MDYKVVAVGDAPAPSWVSERLSLLPQKPARRTIYLLSAPPSRNYPALVWNPEKALHKPAFYYDPQTLSVCQIALAYARYRLKKQTILRGYREVLRRAPLYFMLLDEKGYVRDFGELTAEGIRKYLGKRLYRGLHYRAIVLPSNLMDFEADFRAALEGHLVFTTRTITSRRVEVIMIPFTAGKKRYIAYLATDRTVQYQLLENLAAQREVLEIGVDSLSEGILVLQKDGSITYANALAQTVLGPDITNKALLMSFLQKPEGHILLQGRLIHCKARLIAERDIAIVLIREVTHLYQYEQESQVLRKAWEIGPTGIAIFREEAGELALFYANSRMSQWFSGASHALWSQIQSHLSRDQRRRLSQSLASGEKSELELRGSYAKQGWSHLRLHVYPVSLPTVEVCRGKEGTAPWVRRLWIVVAQDETLLQQITRRRLLAEERETRRILEAQEQERQRLAEALHDQLGASLSVARMTLTTLLQEVPPPLFQKLQTLLTQLDEVIRAVRLTSHLLMPPLVEHFSLLSITEGLIRRFDQASPAMRFRLSVSGEEPPLSVQQKLAIYRILQELLTNALKHSGATEVFVSLRFKARSLVMEVKDNGRGYDPRTISHSSGIGLQNISARLKLLKATYLNRSEPGQGAYFFIEVPLKRLPSPKVGPS